MGTEPTWIVITRDVSSAIRVDGESHLVAAMVLDQATGLVHGASIASTRGDVLHQTIQMALTRPPAPVTPQRPGQILCAVGSAAEVSGALEQLLPGPAPEVRETAPIAAAEDIFDSFIGHMSGRAQPGDLPTPDDWQRLTSATHDYYRAAPWARFSDRDRLNLVVRIGGEASRYVAIVLGQEGIQYGLVLYPGAVVPETLQDWQPGQPVPVPDGMLMCYLDPPAELPEELVARAVRYGWPAGADRVPLWLAGGPDGGVAEVSRPQTQRLTVAAVAVVTRLTDQQASRTTGRLVLAADEQADFTID